MDKKLLEALEQADAVAHEAAIAGCRVRPVVSLLRMAMRFQRQRVKLGRTGEPKPAEPELTEPKRGRKAKE